MFGKLPKELQLEIWQHALQDARIMQLEAKVNYARYRVKKEPSPLLSTCRDSRALVLAREKTNLRLGKICEAFVSFNPYVDILFLTEHEVWMRHPLIATLHPIDNPVDIEDDNTQTAAIYYSVEDTDKQHVSLDMTNLKEAIGLLIDSAMTIKRLWIVVQQGQSGPEADKISTVRVL